MNLYFIFYILYIFCFSFLNFNNKFALRKGIKKKVKKTEKEEFQRLEAGFESPIFYFFNLLDSSRLSRLLTFSTLYTLSTSLLPNIPYYIP
jgi:hypothetical protein